MKSKDSRSETISQVRTEPIELPVTPRLVDEAEKWKTFGRRPPCIVTPMPGQQSVWGFPRPPSLERVLDRVKIEFAGETIVDTTQAIRVCETASPPTYYAPMADVRMDLLRQEEQGSTCEWKGRAIYYSLLVSGRQSVGCAWSYPTPTDEYRALDQTIAFYPGRVDACSVGELHVTPQPGQFYAGWITPDLTGPFKGESGSEGW